MQFKSSTCSFPSELVDSCRTGVHVHCMYTQRMNEFHCAAVFSFCKYMNPNCPGLAYASYTSPLFCTIPS